MAQAGDRFIFTYDPASPAARTLTDTGLSFQFEKGLLGGVRVQRIIQTGEIGSADLRPASEAELGSGGLRAVLGDQRRDEAERVDAAEIRRRPALAG